MGRSKYPDINMSIGRGAAVGGRSASIGYRMIDVRRNGNVREGTGGRHEYCASLRLDQRSLPCRSQRPRGVRPGVECRVYCRARCSNLGRPSLLSLIVFVRTGPPMLALSGWTQDVALFSAAWLDVCAEGCITVGTSLQAANWMLVCGGLCVPADLRAIWMTMRENTIPYSVCQKQAC